MLLHLADILGPRAHACEPLPGDGAHTGHVCTAEGSLCDGIQLCLQHSLSAKLEQVKQIWLLLDANVPVEANERILGEARVSGLLALKLLLRDWNKCFFLTTTENISLTFIIMKWRSCQYFRFQGLISSERSVDTL